MNILVWHVHGAWTTALVQGPHTYMIPVLPDRGPHGRGRAQTYKWPANAVEVSPAEAADMTVDVVILQRPIELERLAEQWLGGRRPGRDVPAVYVEHNAPQGRIDEMRHPAADRGDVTIVHVSHFNRLFWDNGTTPATVIEHGIVDPGYRYQGDLPRGAAVINEARRRGRVTGTDLLPRFSATVGVDLFGIDAAALNGIEDLPQARLHDEIARRRFYLHPIRWTSLGLSLLEAMHLGMPVIALDTTEVGAAVPPGAGVVSNRLDVLEDAMRRLIAEPEAARSMGRNARSAALERHGLQRFLEDWNRVFDEVIT